jgi:hypothetical protein
LPPVEPKPIETGAERAESERDGLIREAREVLGVLNDAHKSAYEEFRVWAAAKDPPVRNIGELDGPALRGAVKKLKALLVAAQTAQAQDTAAEAPQPEGEPDA